MGGGQHAAEHPRASTARDFLAPNVSILAWRSAWTVESMGWQRVGHDWTTFTSLKCQ